MSGLNEIQIRALTDYMFVPDKILKADATLVLGTSLWERPLLRALKLYEQDVAGILVFSGGFNPKIGGAEALAMQARWVSLGLPAERVLLDSASTNTRENMINSKELLATNGLLFSGMKINIVSINYHMRRAIETFKDVFGDEFLVGVANYPSKYCDRASWFQNEHGQKLILAEALKIRRYLPDCDGIGCDIPFF